MSNPTPMRDEDTMLAALLAMARGDERVRAVCLNGSRVNPNVPADLLRDFDVVFITRDFESMAADRAWLAPLGPVWIEQVPADMPGGEGEGQLVIMRQLADGNRVDLRLVRTEDTARYLAEDSLTKVLLDKDGRIGALPPPDESAYYLAQPTAAEYAAACNEFWWVANYVAKGIWRGQALYAAETFGRWLRPQLVKMLGWQVAAGKNWHFNPGKCGDRLQAHLSGETFSQLLATYNLEGTAATATALDCATSLFAASAQRMAGVLGYGYNEGDEAGARAYIAFVRALPKEEP